MISRHARVQDKKAARRGVLLLFLSLLLLGGLLFFGVPTLAKFAGFVVNLQGSGQSIETDDKSAPAPPIFYTTVPGSTKENRLKLNGTAEGGATLFIFQNDEKIKEFVVSETSNFDIELSLDTGENTIWAVVRDSAGNESGESGKIRVILDNEPPSLEVITPADNSSFTGGEKSITVQGKTEKGTRVMVNDRLAMVSGDGTFSQKVNLAEGENIITIVVVDEGENETEKVLKVTYQP